MEMTVKHRVPVYKWIVVLACLLVGAQAGYANDISNGSYSTTDNSNTAAPPNGFPAGMFPNQLEPTNRAVMGATARWWERANPKLSTTGSAGAYVLTPSNTSYPTAYTQGEIYCAKANFTSVGADTLNVNTLGALPLYVGLTAISAGFISSGQQFCASYDVALNSGGGGFQVLTGAGYAIGQIPGTSTNDNAAAGKVGEYTSSTVLIGAAVSLSSNVTANITSISLTAGDWDVWGTAAYGGTFTGATHINAWINTASVTIPTIPNGGAYFNDSSGAGAAADTKAVGMMRISIASTTTVYLSTNVVFSGTATAYGFIGARRVR